MINWIKKLREKSRENSISEIREQSEYAVTVTDFEGDLYFAFNNTPMIHINKEWTSEDIIDELSILRQNFINAKVSLLKEQ